MQEARKMRTYVTALAAMLGLAVMVSCVSALNPLSGNDWDLDPDNDGLTNLDEFLFGSDPNNSDTDGDGLPDGWEADNMLDPNDPADADMDNDYFGGEEYSQFKLPEVQNPYTNYAEYYRFAYVNPQTGERVFIPTNPNEPDTDGDGLLDPDDEYPWVFGTIIPIKPGIPSPPVPNPGPPVPDDNKDSDHDGLLDRDEYLRGTDPYNPDTDGDGLWDPNEFSIGLDPNDWDTDNDGLIDGVEMGSGDSTDGRLDDSDNDGTSGGSGNPTPPAPNPGPPVPPDNKDSDGDGLLDKDEYIRGTDPFNPDTDGDGLSDPMEFVLGLDPNDWDSDNDMLIDGVESGNGDSTDGRIPDSDNDGTA